MTFTVYCYNWMGYNTELEDMTEGWVVAHVAVCRNAHSIIHERESYFVV